MQPRYYLQDDAFVIEQYNNARPFASFLPGIAGFYGKPLWAFYVNRGQCIASFGMNSKDGAIMEYYPANVSYRRVTLEGFRTFITCRDASAVYEPFRIYGDDAPDTAPKQTMYITPHEVRVEEVSRKRGLKTEAVFFTVPGEDFPALARILRITNLASSARHIDIVDGMPKLCPYGLNEWLMKNMSRTIEAWMEVSGLEARKPFYRLRVDAADVAETKYITSGNFYLSVVAGARARPAIIADPRVVFGAFSDLSYPGALGGPGGLRIPAHQADKNITPSAFSSFSATVPAGKGVTLFCLIGHADSAAHLDRIDGKMGERFFADARVRNAAEIAKIAGTVSVFSGKKEFDAYARQTNLDNILRGGLPVTVGKSGKVVYVFNRKHGDLERDYNNFVVQAEYYAQGNGNFRDANQNRRLSVWLNPAIAAKDIRDFYDLIQLDGYNPLIIKGDRFSVPKAADRARLARAHLTGMDKKAADAFLAGEFTIGQLMEAPGPRSPGRRERLLDDVAAVAVSSIQADHGEGYWVDHWTYNLDLVESYLGLYPEKAGELLFGEKVYRFFDNDHVVKPRGLAVARDGHGRIRRYHAVAADPGKAKLIGARKADRTWVRASHGKGRVYTCTLAAKMLVLIANKIASLDPAGVGIEMEADKPGWCDSMNGLPGLFGSSGCETFELARLVRFLIAAVADEREDAVSLSVPAEVAVFIKKLIPLVGSGRARDAGYAYWARSNALKEKYRASVRLGVSGTEVTLGADIVLEFLHACAGKLSAGIGRLYNADGIPYTYFINEALSLDRKNAVKSFKPKPLPLFLEGVVHALKVLPDRAAARELYGRVKKSALYDGTLGMYKLNASLEKEPLEIGRSRAFTPGWLENESVWLHMEYKYLLEVLRSGLYDEFFADFMKALIPFQDAGRYGRSILENSSFLTSSRFFDRDLAGSGFYARLSGATVEFLHMLQIMNLGMRPFSQEDGKLLFCPAPILKSEFFCGEERAVSFAFKAGERQVTLPRRSYAFSVFAHTLIVYENPLLKDTYGSRRVKPSRYLVRYASGAEQAVEGASLGEPFSKDLRSGLIDQITITLE